MISKSIRYFFGGTHSFSESLEFCIEQMQNYISLRNLTSQNILFITIFIKSDKKNFTSHKVAIDIIIKKNNLKAPYIVVAQEPYKQNIAFELMFIEGDFNVIESMDAFKIIEYDGVKELFCSAQALEANKDIDFNSKFAFDKLSGILSDNSFEISNIIRQWNYIEDITELESEQQKYQVFNNARSEFYKTSKWDSGYPAATGIGVKAGGIGINLIAQKLSNDCHVFPIKNPRQKDAHDYSEKVLGGGLLKGYTPKFERGKIIFEKSNINIYVSGTSAIIGEDTITEKDIEPQTLTTIENISELLSSQNLKRNIPQEFYPENLENKNSNLSYLRNYVKNKEDIPLVKKICSKYYADIPVIYLKADICRKELLVEIETGIFLT